MPKSKKVTQSAWWSAELDAALMELVREHLLLKNVKLSGWNLIAGGLKALSIDNGWTFFPNAKQCRLRWSEYLNPKITREEFTKEELVLILNLKKAKYSNVGIAEVLKRPRSLVANALRRISLQPKLAAELRELASRPVEVKVEQEPVSRKRKRPDEESEVAGQPDLKRPCIEVADSAPRVMYGGFFPEMASACAFEPGVFCAEELPLSLSI